MNAIWDGRTLHVSATYERFFIFVNDFVDLANDFVDFNESFIPDSQP